MFGPTSTANNQSPMARSGLSEGPLSNIGTPTTYGKQRNGSRTADEYMIKDALKAQAEASQVWIEEQEETEEQKLIEKNLKFWDEFELNGSGISKDKLEEENDFAKINNDLSEQLHERTLKKLNPDKNSDQKQQQQQQEMWVVLISIGSCADDSSYVQTAMMDCEKQQERGELPEGEKIYKTYQQDLGTQSGGFVLKLAIAGGLLDLFRMLGIEEGLKGEIGAEDELKADEEEEKATPVLTHMRGPPLGYKLFLQITSIGSIIVRDMDMDDGGKGWSTDIAVKFEVGSVRGLKHNCLGGIEIIKVDDEGDSESDERIRYNEASAKVLKAIDGAGESLGIPTKDMTMTKGGRKRSAGTVLAQSEDWSATVNASRGQISFGAYGGHGPGHHMRMGVMEEAQQLLCSSKGQSKALGTKKDPIVVAEIRRIVVSRRRYKEGFKGLEQDKDSTRIKGQKSRRTEEQDREAENRGVRNKRTIRGEALV
ncbi:hypothetical protein BY996DRAFT_6471600 [Phakopsora pachyrhizi]|nr:hypothetical protein BY996DRAFT_6471600 [Phakopsora pachyrhizi]